MKTKTFLAVTILFAAIMLVGCKSKTCKVTAINNYSHHVRIYLSSSNDTVGTKYIIDLPAGQSATKDGIDLSDLNAVFYMGNGNMIAEDIYELEYKGTMDLKGSVGMRKVTITIQKDGTYGLNSSDM